MLAGGNRKIHSPMEVHIRKATETEIEILLEFEQGIVATERPYDNSLKEGEIHYYDLIELIKSEKAEVLVAVVNNEIIASGFAKIIGAEPYNKFREYSYLGFMFVKPVYRGHGINKLILEKLINWSKEKGMTEVRLEVYQENENAKIAYHKAGFKPHLLQMRLEIKK